MSLKTDAFFEADTVAELDAVLREAGFENVRPHLLREFFSLVEYKNARDWNRLVRLSDALAIVGWGDCEPVEAHAGKWLNGRFYTELSTAYFETRYLWAGWSRAGNTFVLGERDRAYHESPDRPGHRSEDSAAYFAKHPDVDREDYGVESLASQRVFLPKNPIRIGRYIGNHYPVFGPFLESLAELRRRLDRGTRPRLYGNSFGYLGVGCCFSNEWSDYFHSESEIPKGFQGKPFVRSRIQYKRLGRFQGELRFVADRYFPSAFGDLPLDEQKRQFGDDLLEMIATLGTRLRAKKLAYDTELLRHDVSGLLDEWLKD